MSDDENVTKKELSPAAQRALAEAAERREQLDAKERELEDQREVEKGGPKKKEPVRYGDWERDGRAYDF
ncbi:MAG: DUF1674 domain-containing protein [Pseudomonadota bacterium]